MDLLADLTDAAYATRREAPLERAVRDLNTLRFLIRLARDLKLMDMDGYGFASGLVEEVGRMCGGWRKASAAK